MNLTTAAYALSGFLMKRNSGPFNTRRYVILYNDLL